MLRMANAASQQAVEAGKERLREFLEQSDTGRRAVAMSGVEMDDRGASARQRMAKADEADDEDGEI